MKYFSLIVVLLILISFTNSMLLAEEMKIFHLPLSPFISKLLLFIIIINIYYNNIFNKYFISFNNIYLSRAALVFIIR